MATEFNLFLPPAAAGTYTQAHPYGPDPTAHFFPDLAIDVQGTAQPGCQALAVVGGTVRMISDPATPHLVTLVLLPSVGKIARDLGRAMGGDVCFVYRNLEYLDTTHTMAQIVAKHTDPDKRDAQQRWYSFANGESVAQVAAGTPLGLPEKNPSGVGQLRFEIVYYSMFGVLSDSTHARTTQLIDPANQKRRFDPTSFFKGILGGRYPDLTIRASDSSSPLWSIMTDRILLEVRDEYDRPYDGVTVQVHEDVSGDTRGHLLAGNEWGHKDIRVPAPGGGTRPSGSFHISRPNHVFGFLPSSPSSEPQPTRLLVAPAHLTLQAIYMADVDDTHNWFAANASPDLPRFTQGNIVTPLIDGLPAFRKMIEAMRTVQQSSHLLCLTAWWLSDDFRLDPDAPPPNDTKFLQLIQEMAAAGAAVHALPWKQTLGTAGRAANNQSVADINALAYSQPGGPSVRVGFAISDGNHPKFGSHHQKALVLSGVEGSYGFLGGIDLNADRLDDPYHAAVSPFHDVHCRIIGPAVVDLYTTFVQRWNNHPDVTSGSLPPISTTPPPVPFANGSSYAQVTRTFARKGGKFSAFAPNGEYGTRKALLAAIARAQRYIYIEDQYLVAYPGNLPYSESADDMKIVKALREALPRIEFLVIVIPNHTTLFQDRKRRENFIGALKAIDPAKVKVYYMRRALPGTKYDGAALTAEAEAEIQMGADDGFTPQGGTPSGGKKYPNEIYVHSKVWIIDDIHAKVGSANVNRRGFTHDTEIDIHVIDGALDNGRRRFALQLRKELWQEHLGVAIPDDPSDAFALWKNLPLQALVEEYQEHKEVRPGTDTTWNNVYDPNGDVQ